MDILFTLIFLGVSCRQLSLPIALIIGLVLAHTINFLVNGQIFVVLKHFGYVYHQKEQIEEYIGLMRKRLQHAHVIQWAAIYGSMSRGEMKPTSDLDLRLVRYPGFYNGLRACWLSMNERTRANFSRFPLDVLVLDSPRLLQRLREDESPIVIYSQDSFDCQNERYYSS